MWFEYIGERILFGAGASMVPNFHHDVRIDGDLENQALPGRQEF
jgi:hypothetical protein